MIEVKIGAKQDGTGDDDGMRLEELEAALTTIAVTNGAGPATRLRIEVNRKGHVRSVTGQIRDGDDERTTGEPGGEGQLELRDALTEGNPKEDASS